MSIIKRQLVRSYVLHRRPFRDTSALLDVLTSSDGRISMVARSSRGTRSRFRGQLEPFCPLTLSWSGRGELKSLVAAEVNRDMPLLQGSALWAGLYLNELLVRLLPREDAHEQIFIAYESALRQLAHGVIELTLRQFEKILCDELGYGLSLARDCQTRDLIESSAYYRYVPEQGFYRCAMTVDDPQVFSGAALVVLRDGGDLQPHLRELRRLMRAVIQVLLGPKPLATRGLWRAGMAAVEV